ncbi:MAG: 2-oxo acid dehydrogenase subunit E2 [Coxiellaceae bacterium]|nr:2-oxo acid dehydrogenase subunit E2 [Coxiellaceae bacterium]
MKIFKLPDLGEGLPDAIIREWHVKVGDEVKTDQSMVSMETAKALVEVPAPFDGKVEKLFGDVDATIETGQPLIGFEGEGEAEETKDAGTVVGAIEQSGSVLKESATGVVPRKGDNNVKATPAVRALAKRLGVDLASISFSGDRITAEDVKKASGSSTTKTTVPSDMTEMLPVRKAMVLSMAKSHREVVPVTLSDEVDISAWKGKDNITLRIIRAIQTACDKEPMLNATFDGEHMAYRLNKEVNLGLAVDTPHGLYVPILKNLAAQTDEQLRETINRFKQQAQSKTLPQDDLHGGTIIFSNFGTIAGRTANPIILPPMTAIVGIGKLYEGVVAIDGKPEVRPVLPISVTVDHRAVTGGELARFLATMMEALKS